MVILWHGDLQDEDARNMLHKAAEVLHLCNLEYSLQRWLLSIWSGLSGTFHDRDPKAVDMSGRRRLPG